MLIYDNISPLAQIWGFQPQRIESPPAICVFGLSRLTENEKLLLFGFFLELSILQYVFLYVFEGALSFETGPIPVRGLLVGVTHVFTPLGSTFWRIGFSGTWEMQNLVIGTQICDRILILAIDHTFPKFGEAASVLRGSAKRANRAKFPVKARLIICFSSPSRAQVMVKMDSLTQKTWFQTYILARSMQRLRFRAEIPKNRYRWLTSKPLLRSC